VDFDGHGRKLLLFQRKGYTSDCHEVQVRLSSIHTIW
jgi:hypothetical protein